MWDVVKILLGGLLSIGTTLIAWYCHWKSERERWLLEQVVRDCVECIDLLWQSKPPFSSNRLQSVGWPSDDFNGRMGSLQHVPAKMASIFLYQSQRGEDSSAVETARTSLIDSINKARADLTSEGSGEKVEALSAIQLAEAI